MRRDSQTKPYFSIVTCTKNSDKYLLKNIKSVQEQNFKNYEHIFIDGYSKDNTLKIINNYKKGNKRVSLYKYIPRGISNAMNLGIKHSNGKFIIHLHSDDYLYNSDVLDSVNVVINSNPGIDWFYGKVLFDNFETGQKRLIPHRKIYKRIRYFLLLITNYIPHQSVFLNKTVFKKYGLFDESLSSSMDYEYWLRLASKGVKSKFIDETISVFSVRKDTQSASGASKYEHPKILEHYVSTFYVLNILKLVHKLNFKRNLF